MSRVAVTVSVTRRARHRAGARYRVRAGGDAPVRRGVRDVRLGRANSSAPVSLLGADLVRAQVVDAR